MGKDKDDAPPQGQDQELEQGLGGEAGDGGGAATVSEDDEDEEQDEHEGQRVSDSLEFVAAEAPLDAKSLVADLRDAVLEVVKRLDKPWGLVPFDQQRDIAAGVEHTCTELVRRAVETIAADPARKPIRCLLVGYADKGDDIKVDLKVKAMGEEETSDAVLALHRAKGKHVMVTVASADDYRQVERGPELMADQPALGFEAGSDEHPADDSDLAGEGGEVPVDELKEAAARDRAGAEQVVVES
jgi:hypothetical protein